MATFEGDLLFDYRARRPTLEILDGRMTSIDLARADHPPGPPRRTRPAGPDGGRARLPLARVLRRRPRHRHPPRRRPVDQPGRDPGGRAPYPPGADHRHRIRRRPAARQRPAWPGWPAPRAGGGPLGPRDDDGPLRASRPSATSPRSPTTSRDPIRSRRWPSSGLSNATLGISIPLGDPARRRRASSAPVSTRWPRRDETTRAYVERLESMVDEERLPAGDELISEIERFLRETGSGGGQRP